MNKLFKSILAVATLATAFVSCSKDENVSGETIQAREIKVNVSADGELVADGTRTYIDEQTGQVNWNATGEILQIIEKTNAGNPAEVTTDPEYTIADRVASFTASFKENTSATEFTYFAAYPSVNYKEVNDTKNPAFYRVQVPAEQTPAETSFDPAADLLVSLPIERTTQPAEGESLAFRFRRLAAINKLTLKGIEEGEKIAKVELSASQKLTGYYKIDLNTFEASDPGYYGEKTLTLAMNDRTATGADVVWFTTLPCVLGETDTFTVKVTTDQATYEKTINIGETARKELTFDPSQVTIFAVSGMTRQANVTDNYTLLTDIADLQIGDKIIITSGTDGAVKALGTTQNTNNRAAEDITIADNTITTIPSDVQVIDIEEGTVPGSFAFNVGTGYLYAAGGTEKNNYLKTQSDLTSTASWTITINDSKATIVTVDKETVRNTIRFNSTLFSCYASGQSDVYIFHKAGTPKTALDTPQNIEAVAEGNTITVGWDAVTGAKDYTVKYNDQSVTTEDTIIELTDLSYSTEYTISVVANPADTENFGPSAPATVEVSTGSDTRTPLDAIKLTQDDVAVEGNTIELMWSADGLDEFIANYTIKYNDKSVTTENNESYYTLTDLQYNTTYSISIIAHPAQPDLFTDSPESNAIEVTTEADPNAGQGGTVTFDFATITDINNIKGSVISLNFEANGGTTSAINSNLVRFYAKNKLTISGANITKVEITYDSSDKLKYVKELTVSTGSFSISNATGTWTGSASSIVFTNNQTAQARIQKIVVTYGEGGGETPEPEPEPTITVNTEKLDFVAAGESKNVTVTTANAEGCTIEATADKAQFSAAVEGNTVTVTAAANETTAAITGTLKIALKKDGAEVASTTVALSQAAQLTGGDNETKVYTLEITPSEFTSNGGYAPNNGDKTLTAKSSDGNTTEVIITTNQIMLQDSGMQWQKSKGYLYNKTDLGTINTIKIESSAGTYTVKEGTVANPTTGTTITGQNGVYSLNTGYCLVSVGSATGKTSKITITFTK